MLPLKKISIVFLACAAITAINSCSAPAYDSSFTYLKEGWKKDKTLSLSLVQTGDTSAMHDFFLCMQFKRSKKINGYPYVPLHISAESPSGKYYGKDIRLPVELKSNGISAEKNKGVINIEWLYIKKAAFTEKGTWKFDIKQGNGNFPYNLIRFMGIRISEKR
ncbi:MAG: hypothetical protein LKI53_02890 [Bacteroidales bacterium]|jgi:hypothetical protein|nr:hypothetical protein [Bacteroidales bacterium]